jgi:hypothetical protein
MHNKLFFGEKPITLIKRKRFYRWALYIFSFFFGLVICYEPQTWDPMAVEKMYIIYFMHIDFIQSSSFNHGSNLILIPNELWVPKYCHACHQDFNLLYTYHICSTSLFWVKIVFSYYVFTLNMFLHLKCHLLTSNTFHNHNYTHECTILHNNNLVCCLVL